MSPEFRLCALSRLERRRDRLTVSLYSAIRYLERGKRDGGGGGGRNKQGEGGRG